MSRTRALREHIEALLAFYDPIARDDAVGGYNNQLRDDGTIYDRHTKHVVGTCRFAVNYALAARCFPERAGAYREMCAHGIHFLMESHQDTAHGGFCWVLRGNEVVDGTKWCYSLAFGLLALSNAKLSGVPNVDKHLRTISDFAESVFYEPAHGLYIDSFDRPLAAANPYRGQNANMHMCEALIALFEATGEQRHLERATAIARRLCVELSAGCGWVRHVAHHLPTKILRVKWP